MTAVLVFAATALQVAIAVQVSGTPHEVSTGLLRGASLPGRVIRVFSFFTIQSNLLCGIVTAQLAALPDRDGPAWRPLRLAALFGITVTGIVDSTVLAAIHQPNGTAETLVNLAVHYPFVDAASHGYLRVAANGVLLTLVLGAVAALSPSVTPACRALPRARAAQLSPVPR